MSSEAATGGRCLMCNLGCRIRLETFAPQRWRPAHEADDRGHLCARGLMLADLASQPARLYRPRQAGGESTLDKTVEILADRLRAVGDVRGAGGRLAIWLDGNVALEDLEAARLFCTRWDGATRLRVHVPPHELGAVEGIDAAGIPLAPPERWAEADAFLLLGDPLAVAPPVASKWMRWGRARRDTPTIVIDEVSSVASAYASDPLICKPGHVFEVAAALLKEVGGQDVAARLKDLATDRPTNDDSGVESDRVHRAATQLRSARRPAVVVAPSSGSRSAWRAVTALAGGWAVQNGGTCTVLTSCANALATARYLRQHRISAWSDEPAEPAHDAPDMLLVIGWDPSSAYPGGAWEAVADEVGCVVCANAFPPDRPEWIDLHLPLALGVEAGGTYVLVDGNAREVGRVLAPPQGIPTIAGLLGRLSVALEGKGKEPVSEHFRGLRVPEGKFEASPVAFGAPPMPALTEGEGGMVLTLRVEPSQYADGQMTRHARWVAGSNALPVVTLSAGDAKRLCLADGGLAVIRNACGRARVRVYVHKDQPEFVVCAVEGSDVAAGGGTVQGWGGVSGCFAEIRRLVDLASVGNDTPGHAGTLRVTIEPVRPTAAVGEGVHVHG